MKRFMEHTPAWRAKAIADGVEPRRWDRWISLSPATRKKSSQREYAKGLSARESELLEKAVDKVFSVQKERGVGARYKSKRGKPFTRAVVRKALLAPYPALTTDDLERLSKMSLPDLRYQLALGMSQQNPPDPATIPRAVFWYHY